MSSGHTDLLNQELPDLLRQFPVVRFIYLFNIICFFDFIHRLNNIYSVGEYFFIDFSVENKTNIRFDIDEMRIKLSDKKQSKATNAQIVELTPSLVLDDAKTFKYGYRNVIVVKKMTFPNDKVLTIELSEKQISGRTISLSIDYEDVLSADSFNHILLEEE